MAEIVGARGSSWAAPLALLAGVHLLELTGQERDPWSRFREVLEARREGLSYNQFVAGCRKAEIELDRKILADLAVNDPAAFSAVAERAKAALEA